MAINLITGHYGTDHITSLDARAMNRSIFGKNPFRAYSEYNTSTATNSCILSASATTGGYTMTLGIGTIYWNGMFIRLTSGETSETVASCEGYKVYLHYSRSGSTEYIEVLFTQASYTEQRAFADTASSAYLKIGEFTNASGTMYSYDIPIMPDLITRATEMNAKSAGATGQSQTKLLCQQMFANASSLNDESMTQIALDEKITNFEQVDIQVKIGNSYFKKRVPTIHLEYNSNSNTNDVVFTKWNRNVNEIDYFTFRCYHSNNGATFNIGKLFKFVNNSFTAETAQANIYIYGIGRIAN